MNPFYFLNKSKRFYFSITLHVNKSLYQNTHSFNALFKNLEQKVMTCYNSGVYSKSHEVIAL